MTEINDPDLTVSRGAAIYAGYLADEKFVEERYNSKVRIQTVVPEAIGIDKGNGKMDKIIERNS